MAWKWEMLVIWRLKDGVMRFGELQRLLPDSKQSSLTQQLRELELMPLFIGKFISGFPLKCRTKPGEWPECWDLS